MSGSDTAGVARQGSTPPPAREPADAQEGELYCICHGRDNGLFMYQCDICGEWYHGACTGLKESEVEHKAPENVVLCPDCCLEHAPLSDLELLQRRVIRNELVPGARGIIIKKIDTQNHSDSERRKRFSMLLADALCSTDKSPVTDERRAMAQRRADDVERVIYETAHCDAASKSYLLRTRSVIIAVHENTTLLERVMNGECTAQALAAAEPKTLSVSENQVSRRRLAEKLRHASSDDDDDDGMTQPFRRPSPNGESSGSAAKKKRSRLASADVVWDGVIERNDKSTHGPCSVAGQYVAGTKNLHRLVPEHIIFAGRFELEELLDYLHQLGHSTSRKYGVLLLEPRDKHDAVHYNTMYRHFMEKRRAGYLKRAPGFDGDDKLTQTNSDMNPGDRSTLDAEELYMVPLQRGPVLPQFLRDDPFTNKDALATESSHPRLLLVAVARNTTIDEDSKLLAQTQITATAAAAAATTTTTTTTEPGTVSTEVKDEPKDGVIFNTTSTVTSSSTAV